MRLEIDIPEHHYNNIIALDSVSLGRVPYKGIIMYTINAIKHGKVLEQEPTTKNDLGVDCISRAEMLKYQEYLHGKMSNEENHKLWKFIKDLPSVAPQEPQIFKWCDTCREYDQEKHCCHRWSKVIRDTVEEMKQEPEPILDKIRAEIAELSHYYPMGHDYQIAITRCLAVIDKYKAETEATDDQSGAG